MTPEEHRVCDLEKQIAVLRQQVADADKALSLSNSVHKMWAGLIVAIVLGIIADGLTIVAFFLRH
jgi:hypothetical protein